MRYVAFPSFNRSPGTLVVTGIMMVVIGTFFGCHSHKPLTTKFKQLDERITLLELRRSETEAALRDLEVTRNELEILVAEAQTRHLALEADIRAMQEEITRLQELVANLKKDLDAKQMQVLPSQKEKEEPASPPQKETRRIPKPSQERNRGVTSAYRAAIKLLEEGKAGDAATTLQTITQDHAAHVLAPNAHYWLGEIAYDARDYAAAITFFQNVLDRYPKSNKAPDALLKMGKCRERMGQIEQAMETYREVMQKFPDSRAAKLAQEWTR